MTEFRVVKQHYHAPSRHRRCVFAVVTTRNWPVVFIYHIMLQPVTRVVRQENCSKIVYYVVDDVYNNYYYQKHIAILLTI